MNELVSGIEKLRYTSTFFSMEKMDLGSREAYEIFPGGLIRYYAYEGHSRKPYEKRTFKIRPAAVEKLFEEIVDCFQTAEFLSLIIDDCGGEAALTYDGGQLVLPRGLGKDGVCIGSIMEDFIYRFRQEGADI